MNYKLAMAGFIVGALLSAPLLAQDTGDKAPKKSTTAPTAPAKSSKTGSQTPPANPPPK